MERRGHTFNELQDYRGSVHARLLYEEGDLSAPTCNDCHGNHGAKPPGVESLAYVCGNCHGKQAELFRQSAMKVAFDDMELGECIVCHGNHDIEPPSDELLAHQPPDQAPEGNVCYLCHSEADDPGLVASTKMYGALTGLEASIGEAEGVITDAEQKGMPVAQAEYQLSGARDALIEARVEIHRFVADPVLEACEKGAKIADESRSLGVAAIGEYFFRHRWLAISLLGIAFVIVCLVLKVRQVDRRWRSTIAASSPPSGDGGGAA